MVKTIVTGIFVLAASVWVPGTTAFAQENGAGSTQEGKQAVATATPEYKNPPLFLAQAKNEVYVVHQGDKKKASPPQPLSQDDHIVTGSDAKADLELESGGTIEIGPQSDVKVGTLNITPETFQAKFLMALGRIKVMLHKLTTPASSFEIEAGGVITGVRGTVFGVDFDKNQNQVSAQTFEGSVFTKSNGQEQTVDHGFSLVFAKGPPLSAPLTSKQKSEFESFLDVSNLLEKKKDEMMNRMKDKAMQDIQEKAKEQMNKKLGEKAGNAADDGLNKKTGGGFGGGSPFGF